MNETRPANHSHHHPHRNGWRGILRNFVLVLVVWILTQIVTFAGFMVSNLIFINKIALKQDQLFEWKGSVDQKMSRMDEQGTLHSHEKTTEQDTELADLKARVKAMEAAGIHWEVIETEHRRLTADVEELRHGKK